MKNQRSHEQPLDDEMELARAKKKANRLEAMRAEESADNKEAAAHMAKVQAIAGRGNSAKKNKLPPGGGAAAAAASAVQNDDSQGSDDFPDE